MVKATRPQPGTVFKRLHLRQLPAPAVARAIRVAAHLTQEELAREIGVDRVTLARWEAGRRRPQSLMAERYGRALAEIASPRGGG